jgi:hypothetical protein
MATKTTAKTTETTEDTSNVAPTNESIAEQMADVKRQQDVLTAQSKTLREQKKALRATAPAKPTKTLEEVEAEQRDERIGWAIGYVIVRVQARERAGQERTDALQCVLDNLAAGVRQEMGLRASRRAEKAASHAEEEETE